MHAECSRFLAYYRPAFGLSEGVRHLDASNVPEAESFGTKYKKRNF